MAVFTWLSLILLTVLYSIYKWSKRNFDYWEKQNVPYLKPVPIFGNYGPYILLKKFVGHLTQDICRKFPDKPYVGAFYGSDPTLIVRDPELLKIITTKDFYYFNSREVAEHTTKEVMTQNLFFTYGDRWRVMRQNLTLLFSSAKMRNMFPLVKKCAFVFEDLLDDITSQTDIVGVRSLMARFTMDSIGSCAFGVESNAMGKDSNNLFRKMGNMIFEISNIRGFCLIGRSVWPSIFYGVGLKTFPTELNMFFSKLLVNVFKSRNYESSSRNDFIDLIMKFKKNSQITGDSIVNLKTGADTKVNLKADDDFMVSQCLTFFAGGFETSATTTSFTLFELAKNLEAQDRAYEEVVAYLAKKENKLDYDCVHELPYIAACVDEALRLYPVLSILTRELVEDYTLPDGVRLERGNRVHIPVYTIQRDPDNFPEPEEYRPERFLAENKKNIKPYTYMPFGEGHRLCIGMRFAKMQIFAGMVTLLKKYRVELPAGTPKDITFEPRSIVTATKHPLNLRLVPREGWQQRLHKRD